MYSGYDQNIHPQIAHVFQSAAMRFGHTMVPPGVLRRSVFSVTSLTAWCTQCWYKYSVSSVSNCNDRPLGWNEVTEVEAIF